MADFGEEGNRAFARYKDVLTTGVRNGSKKLDDQTVDKPTFWIEVTSGMSGYFAVMLWNGGGFAEPWDTGMGRLPRTLRIARDARAPRGALAAEEGHGLVSRLGNRLGRHGQAVYDGAMARIQGRHQRRCAPRVGFDVRCLP